MLIQQPYRQFSGKNTLFWITVLWSKNVPNWHEVLLIIIYLFKKKAFQHSESKHYFNTDFAGYSIWGFIGLACMILSVPSQPNLPRFHLTIVHLFSLMAPESSVCSAEGCSPHLTVNGGRKHNVLASECKQEHAESLLFIFHLDMFHLSCLQPSPTLGTPALDVLCSLAARPWV